jgi:hypothetical protein
LQCPPPLPKAHDLFSADGELTDPETTERLAEIVAGLMEHHSRFSAPAAA